MGRKLKELEHKVEEECYLCGEGHLILKRRGSTKKGDGNRRSNKKMGNVVSYSIHPPPTL